MAGYVVSKYWKCARIYLQMCKTNKVGKHYHNCEKRIPAQVHVEHKVLDSVLIIIDHNKTVMNMWCNLEWYLPVLKMMLCSLLSDSPTDPFWL